MTTPGTHPEPFCIVEEKYNRELNNGRGKPMCGIVGFIGNRQAAPILLDGLSKLEYRGYDSAGLAVRDGENLAQVVKAKGRLSNLIEKTDGGKALKGTCGIGHTRWATHGEPSQTNAHPHVSGNCTRSGSGTVESEVVGVHNGIIENYQLHSLGGICSWRTEARNY